MKSMENNEETLSSSRVYLEEQNALIRAGKYWNCLTAARELSARLLAAGKSPWIARLRKTEDRGGRTFHAPLIPLGLGVTPAWTTHYVCCCDRVAYDALAGRPLPIEMYSLEVFGEQISLEVFVTVEELPAYLAGKRA
jgi:hypothetical protein